MIKYNHPTRLVLSLALVALLGQVAMACSDEPAESLPDTGLEQDADDGDTSTMDDTGSSDDAGADLDAGDDTYDTGPSTDDVGSDAQQDDVSDGPDASDAGGGNDVGDADDVGDPDTGPTDPPDCGGDLWDDNHDGSNPWENFDIDCDELAASWDCNAAAGEEQILSMINQARQEEQLCGSTSYGPSATLVMDPQLRCAARIHSWDQVGRNYYDHTTPEGMSPSQRVSIVPGPHNTAAENIYNWFTSVDNIFQGWMDSPGHCRNMMCPSYVHVGIGSYQGMHTLKIIGPGICAF